MNMVIPKAGQEKHQRASSAKAWNVPKNITLVQLRVNGCLSTAAVECVVINFSFDVNTVNQSVQSVLSMYWLLHFLCKLTKAAKLGREDASATYMTKSSKDKN
jgi:hypothetical protein